MKEPEKTAYREADEEFEAALFRAAFARLEAERIEELMAQEPTPEEEAFFARTQQETLRVIRRTLNQKKRRHFLRHTLPRAANAAALLLLCVFLGGTAAVAAVPSVRVRVMKLLTHMQQEYTEISLVEDASASFDVPDGWKGDFFPGYIPEGFEVAWMSLATPTIDWISAEYDNGGIGFSECDENTVANVDTENAKLSYEEINGSLALVIEKGDVVQIVWVQDDRYFILDTHACGRTETMQIAKSVKRIK